MKLQEDEEAVLFVEPRGEKIWTGAADYEWLREKLKTARPSAAHYVSEGAPGYMGVHECICGEESSSSDLLFPNNMYTNSLCMHYLEWHRHEIPEIEFKKLEQLRVDVQFDQCSRCHKYKSTLEGFKSCRTCRERRRARA